MPSPLQPSAASDKNPTLLFGALAVRYGFVSEEQLQECRDIQVQQRTQGVKAGRLGDIMVSRGYLTTEQAQKVFDIQGREGGHRQIEGYRLLGIIGQGGMGVVYKGVQISMDRHVAIKLLYPKLARDRLFVDRFLREARASAKLNHINVVSGIDVGESNGIYYFAMEFVDGRTVQQILTRGGAMDERRVLGIAIQIAKALDHALKQGILHRDVKPSNILLTADGTAKLCDLGLATSVAESHRKDQAGLLGTPYYISPEQARSRPDSDHRSDIYSLGATMYHMLTGQPPYRGKAPEVVSQHYQAPIPDPRDLVPGLHPITSQVVRRCLAKKPEERYQSHREVIAALESLQTRLQATAGDGSTLPGMTGQPGSDAGLQLPPPQVLPPKTVQPPDAETPGAGHDASQQKPSPKRTLRRRGVLGRHRRLRRR